jgi:hypothetical protein
MLPVTALQVVRAFTDDVPTAIYAIYALQRGRAGAGQEARQVPICKYGSLPL